MCSSCHLSGPESSSGGTRQQQDGDLLSRTALHISLISCSLLVFVSLFVSLGKKKSTASSRLEVQEVQVLKVWRFRIWRPGSPGSGLLDIQNLDPWRSRRTRFWKPGVQVLEVGNSRFKRSRSLDVQNMEVQVPKISGLWRSLYRKVYVLAPVVSSFLSCTYKILHKCGKTDLSLIFCSTFNLMAVYNTTQ